MTARTCSAPARSITFCNGPADVCAVHAWSRSRKVKRHRRPHGHRRRSGPPSRAVLRRRRGRCTQGVLGSRAERRERAQAREQRVGLAACRIAPDTDSDGAALDRHTRANSATAVAGSVGVLDRVERGDDVEAVVRVRQCVDVAGRKVAVGHSFASDAEQALARVDSRSRSRRARRPCVTTSPAPHPASSTRCPDIGSSASSSASNTGLICGSISVDQTRG